MDTGKNRQTEKSDSIGRGKEFRASRIPFSFLVVEKILGPYETLREDWPVYGTSGYDFLPDFSVQRLQPVSMRLSRLHPMKVLVIPGIPDRQSASSASG